MLFNRFASIMKQYRGLVLRGIVTFAVFVDIGLIDIARLCEIHC